MENFYLAFFRFPSVDNFTWERMGTKRMGLLKIGKLTDFQSEDKCSNDKKRGREVMIFGNTVIFFKIEKL